MDTPYHQPAPTLDQALKEIIQPPFNSLQPSLSNWLRLKERIGHTRPKNFHRQTRWIYIPRLRTL